jgi:hypothetical protein
MIIMPALHLPASLHSAKSQIIINTITIIVKTSNLSMNSLSDPHNYVYENCGCETCFEEKYFKGHWLRWETF